MLKFQTFITREDLQDNPETLFVFGDNMRRVGYGGQAREMRGEVNAVGIPTKREPSNLRKAFFTDGDLFVWIQASRGDLFRLKTQLTLGNDVVWPSAGIGYGRAQLEYRAPCIAKAIRDELAELVRISDG